MKQTILKTVGMSALALLAAMTLTQISIFAQDIDERSGARLARFMERPGHDSKLYYRRYPTRPSRQ